MTNSASKLMRTPERQRNEPEFGKQFTSWLSSLHLNVQ